jgi:RND family efflux transporter MFP subunit
VPDQAHGESDHGHHHGPAAVAAEGEAISFLKEQQWRTGFATAWTQEGTVHRVARGFGNIRPVAGAEAVLTAPLDGVVAGEPWPYVGLEVDRETVLFRLTRRVASGRSLAELDAIHAEKEAALDLAEQRLARLERLLVLEAVSKAEVEAARGRVTTLRAQHAVASADVATAQGGQLPPDKNGLVSVSAPLSGQVAEVFVTPGEVVAAGKTLARVVRVQPFWVEVFLPPDRAALLGGEVGGLSIRGTNDANPVSFGPEEVQLVSWSPEVSRRTNTVTCIFEVLGAVENIRVGSAVEVEVFLPETLQGIVIPASAVVDDGGVPVVYVQQDGEGFTRQEIAVRAREGGRLLVEGLEAEQRLVTEGGAAIRRATLVSSGVGEGHVH